MADSDITIKVKVDAQGAVTLLDATGKAIKKTGEEAEKAESSFNAFGSVLQGIAQGVGQQLYNTLKQLPGVIVDFAKRGSEVDDIAQAFKRLSDSAGTTADVFLSQLQEATAGTISKFDLMQRANEALNAGLRPDQLNTVAEAARALGETFGGDLKTNFDGVLDSLQRGNDTFLKKKGILVDNKRAEEEYAASLNTTRENLSELEKAEANRLAVTRALQGEIDKVGSVTLDTGDAFSRFDAIFSDAYDSVSEAIGTNKELNTALIELGNTLRSIDGGTFIQAINTALTELIKTANAAITSFSILKGLVDATATRTLPDIIRNFDAIAGAAIFKAIIPQQFQKITEGVLGIGAATKSVSTDILKLNSEYIAKLQQVESQTKANLIPTETARKLQEELKNAYVKSGGSAQTFGLLLERTTGKIKDTNKEQKTLIDLNKEYSTKIKDVIEQEHDHIISTEQADRALKDLQKTYDASTKSAGNFGAIQQHVVSELDDVAKHAEELHLELEKGFQNSLVDLGKSLFEGSDAIKGALTNVGSTGGALIAAGLKTELTNILPASLGVVAGPLGTLIGSTIGSSLTKRVNEDIDLLLQGKGRRPTKDLLDSIFPGLGTGLDAVVGDKLFKGDSAGTTAKKGADKYFADLFNASRLSVVIDGQLKEVKDLVFSGNQNGGLFESLSESTKNAFSGVGAAFESLLGIDSDLGVNIGNVLANNIGGSLNNLQLLVQATGQSFEDLKEQTVNAFLDGKLSIDDANSALAGLAQVAQQGVPDGIGLIDVAFQNLEAAGTKGGRALIDALQDIGYEAKELGIRDFGGLQAELQKRMPQATDEINKLFDALQTNGISSIEQLTSATAEQLLPVLGKLTSTEFPFAKQAEEAQQLIDKLESFPEEINSKINLEVNTKFTGDTQKYVDSGGQLPTVGVSPGQ